MWNSHQYGSTEASKWKNATKLKVIATKEIKTSKNVVNRKMATKTQLK